MSFQELCVMEDSQNLLNSIVYSYISLYRKKVKSLSHVQPFATPWTVTYQNSLSVGFFQEWVAFPSPGNLPNPGIKPGFPALLADALLSEPPGKSRSQIFL